MNPCMNVLPFYSLFSSMPPPPVKVLTMCLWLYLSNPGREYVLGHKNSVPSWEVRRWYTCTDCPRTIRRTSQEPGLQPEPTASGSERQELSCPPLFPPVLCLPLPLWRESHECPQLYTPYLLPLSPSLHLTLKSVLRTGKESTYSRCLGCGFKESYKEIWDSDITFLLPDPTQCWFLGNLFFPLAQRRKWCSCIKQAASSVNSSGSLTAENQTFYQPQSSRCSANRLRFLFVDFPRWSMSTSGEKKNSNSHFYQTPSWRITEKFMLLDDLRGLLWHNFPWEFLRDLFL